MKIILLISLFFNLSFCEIFVITSTKNKLLKVSKKELTDIYLKKRSKIRGIKVIPMSNRQNYAEFCKNVMKKTPKQIREYWARELYKGTKKPPKMRNDNQIRNAIKHNPKVISYASHKLIGKVILKVSN